MRSGFLLLVAWAIGSVACAEHLACPVIPNVPSLKALFELHVSNLQKSLTIAEPQNSLSVIYFRQKNEKSQPEFVLIFCQQRTNQKCIGFVGMLVSTREQSSVGQRPLSSIRKYIQSDSLPEIKTFLGIKDPRTYHYDCDGLEPKKPASTIEARKGREWTGGLIAVLREKPNALSEARALPLTNTFDNLDDDLDSKPLPIKFELNKISTLASVNVKNLVVQPVANSKEAPPPLPTTMQKSTVVCQSKDKPNSVSLSTNTTSSHPSQSKPKNATLNLDKLESASPLSNDARTNSASQNGSLAGKLGSEKTEVLAHGSSYQSETDEYLQSLYKKYSAMFQNTDQNLSSPSHNSMANDTIQATNGTPHYDDKYIRSSTFGSANAPMTVIQNQNLWFNASNFQVTHQTSYALTPSLSADTPNADSDAVSVTVNEQSSSVPEVHRLNVPLQNHKTASLEFMDKQFQTRDKGKTPVLYPNLSEISEEILDEPRPRFNGLIGSSSVGHWSSNPSTHNALKNELLSQHLNKEAEHAIVNQIAKEDQELLQKLYLILAYKQRGDQHVSLEMSSNKVRPTEFLYDNYLSENSGRPKVQPNSHLSALNPKDSQLSYFANLSTNDLVKVIAQKEQLLSLLRPDQSSQSNQPSHIFSLNQNFESRPGFLNKLIGPSNRIEVLMATKGAAPIQIAPTNK
jgi:hypothetical protein